MVRGCPGGVILALRAASAHERPVYTTWTALAHERLVLHHLEQFWPMRGQYYAPWTALAHERPVLHSNAVQVAIQASVTPPGQSWPIRGQ